MNQAEVIPPAERETLSESGDGPPITMDALASSFAGLARSLERRIAASDRMNDHRHGEMRVELAAHREALQRLGSTVFEVYEAIKRIEARQEK